jgi:hypothetical protein
MGTTPNTTSVPPPFHWVKDQARAWRLVAAICDHDGSLFDITVAEARDDGPEDVDKLLAALARNLVVRLRMAIGMTALDELITAELSACQQLHDDETRPAL